MRISAPLCALVALLSACSDPPATTDSGEGSSTGTTATTSGPTVPTTSMGDLTSTGFQLVCFPGDVRCSPDLAGVVETCKDTGLEWEQTACAENAECVEDVEAGTAACIGPCEKITSPTSIGCEFLAIRMNSFNADPDDKDALIVGNTDADRTAGVQLYFTPNNSFIEEKVGDVVLLAPGESQVFDLVSDLMNGFSSLRNGGVYRVESDLPVTAYLHSALDNKASNDASMLLPTPTLRRDYVVASYPGFVNVNNPMQNGRPSYFVVIALENDTHVEWTSPARTAAGVPVPMEAIEPGETGALLLNRFDVIQIGSSSPDTDFDYETHDLSGTVVHADKPIWVVGATECAFVPFTVGFCNHLQEQMIPMEYWGKRYIGPHSPARSDERHYWRVYAGGDGLTQVVVESNGTKVPPFFFQKRGEMHEFSVDHGTSLVFEATGPILPVQYLTGGNAADSIGDPAMYQMIAVEQWLSRYVFVTGVNYDLNYAQVIRKQGAADVMINGQLVTGYQFVSGIGPDNGWEIADVPLGATTEPVTYVAESADPFNITVVGYNQTSQGEDLNQSAYAFPGGMNLKPLNDL